MALPAYQVAPIQRIVLQSIFKIFKPLAHLAVHHGLDFQSVSRSLRKAFIQAAEKHPHAGKKASNVSVQALTGIDRTVIAQLRAFGPGPTEIQISPIVAILAKWSEVHKSRSTLPVKGPGPSFAGLVDQVGRNISASAALRILVDARCIEYVSEREDVVRLISRTFIPHSRDEANLIIEGFDGVRMMLSTVVGNLAKHKIGKKSSCFFQRYHYGDSIPQETIDAFRQSLGGVGSAAMSEAIKVIREFDGEKRPLDPNIVAGLGIYYFEVPSDHRE